MGEKVCRRLLGLLAKWTKTTIIPTSSFNMIRRPNPTPNGQPRKELELWSRPSFPNHLVESRESSYEELCIISRSRGVLIIGGEIPNNGILIILMEKMHILKVHP
jgi:hypothetical protein